MQTQDKYVSAIDKIKYYETLSKGRCGAEQKFRSKAYSPTPYSNISIATQICSVNKAAFNVNQNGIHTEEDNSDTGPKSDAQDGQVMNSECLTATYYGRHNTEGTVADVVREQMADEAKFSEPELFEETGRLDVIIGKRDDKTDRRISPKVKIANSVEKNDNNEEKEDIEACSDPVMTSIRKCKIKIGTHIEQIGCKRKLPVRSKLPVKASNKEAKSALHRQLTCVKEDHTKEAPVVAKQVSDCTKNSNMPKIYDEQMERKKNFEIETDSLETEIESQLRKLCDKMESLNAKTKEIETIIGDFVDTITAFPKVKFELESTDILDIHADKNNTDSSLEKNANVNKEIHDWFDEIKERRVASLENLQHDIKKMNHFLELLKQSYRKYCKTGTFLREGDREQPITIRKMTKTTETFQNQKPDLASISKDFEQNRKGNENVDFKTQHGTSVVDSEVQDIKICESFRENCNQEDDKGYNFKSSINASLDLALSSSIQGGSKSRSQRNKSKRSIVRQMSEEKLVSSQRAKERKTKIPKPTWQAYQNVSRDRKQNEHLLESGDHSNTVIHESAGSDESNLTLQYEDASNCSLITDHCTTLATDKMKQNIFRQNTKDVKAKIDTGLKTKSGGKIKIKSKNISHSFKTKDNTLTDNVNSSSYI